MEVKANRNCPSVEELSAYYDQLQETGETLEAVLAGELLPGAVTEHLRVCVECRRIVASYGRLDAVMGTAISVPAGLSERLLAGCHQAAENDRAADEMVARGESRRTGVRVFSGKFLRRVAVVALMGAAGVVGYCLRQPSAAESTAMVAEAPSASGENAMSGQDGELMMAAAEAPAAMAPLPVAAVAETAVAEPAELAVAEPAVPAAAAEKAVADDDLAIDLDKALALEEHGLMNAVPEAPELALARPVAGVAPHALRAVGMNGSLGRRQRSRVVPRGLEPTVRHVWTVKDLGACRRTLESLRGQHGIGVSFMDDGDEDRLIAVVEGISDRELQALVDVLESRQWALVSPFLPQPHQPERVKFTGRPVAYTLWAVRKEQ